LKPHEKKTLRLTNQSASSVRTNVCISGLMFSKDGVSPDPSKVPAIRATDLPRSAKELNSFLCTVQYNARFMKKFASSTEKLRILLKVEI
jgi:hypothetical protein